MRYAIWLSLHHDIPQPVTMATLAINGVPDHVSRLFSTVRRSCHSSDSVRSDPTPWCFIPLGDRRITRCSAAFLRLWGLPGDFLDRFPSGISVHDDSLRMSFDRLGVGVEVLSRIADGGFPSYDASILLVRNDNIRLLANWAPVLDERGRPSGRLIRFSPQIPGHFTDQMVTIMAEARRRLSVLSEREQEVLNHLFEGKTTKQLPS